MRTKSKPASADRAKTKPWADQDVENLPMGPQPRPSRRRFSRLSREIQDAIEETRANGSGVPLDQLEEWLPWAKQMERRLMVVAKNWEQHHLFAEAESFRKALSRPKAGKRGAR